MGVPLLWQDTQRVCPSRFARKMGCILVLKYSKSRADPGGPGAWARGTAVAGYCVSNAARSRTNRATRMMHLPINRLVRLDRQHIGIAGEESIVTRAVG